MTTSRRGRIPVLLGILSAVVRRGRGKSGRRTSLAGGIAVPRGVGVTPPQAVTVAGGVLHLIR